MSVGFTAAACTRMRTSPGPAWASGTSRTWRTSGPPCFMRPTARIVDALPGVIPQLIIKHHMRERLLTKVVRLAPKIFAQELARLEAVGKVKKERARSEPFKS